ncbi:hypothetical protein Ddc_13277 [Ditylenchus destructor]|nr:hypothetical protein Ddc_13277 [Ditylenchus destructor]
MNSHFAVIMMILPVLIFLAFRDICGVSVPVRHAAPTHGNEKLFYLHLSKISYYGHTYDFQELNSTLSMPVLRGAVNRAGLRDFADFLHGLPKETLQKLSDFYDKPDQDNWNIEDIVGYTVDFEDHMTNFKYALKNLQKYDLDVSYMSSNETGQIHCPCQLCIRDDKTCIDMKDSMLDFLPAEGLA